MIGIARPARASAALLALFVALPSCATPRISLSPRLPDGETRVYRVTADATTEIDLAGTASRERTILRADVLIRIGREAGAPVATLTFSPTGFEQDGRRAEPPPEQTATIAFDAAGRIESIRSPDGESVPFGGSADDIGTIFGSTIARGVVRIADRWSEPLGEDRSGLRRSRVASLRWVGGYRCALIESATRRPAERSRGVGGTTLRLTGVETALVTTSFAFDYGLPVAIEAAARGAFTVVGAPQQGSVTITSTTTMTLLRRTGGATTTATARASGSRRPARS